MACTAALLALAAADADAQVAGALAGLAGGGRQAPQLDQAPADAPGYLGVRVVLGKSNGAQIVEVAPGSAADLAGLKPGDTIFSATDASPGFHRPRPLRDQASIEAWEAAKKAGAKQWLDYRPAGATFMASPVMVTLGVATVAQTASGPAAPTSGGMEAARAAYQQMCAKGQQKVSAATCAGMRGDLDKAEAAQAATLAAAAREVEVMGVYNRLCAPGAKKLSDETCAAMLAEAKRTLAASAR